LEENNGVKHMLKLAFFIDGANFFFSQKSVLNWMIDPGKLKKYVGQWGEVVDARYYLSVDQSTKDERKDRYQKALYHMGYSVIPIPVKIIETEYGTKEKADADVRMVIDAVLAADNYDMFVLLSGDSDFTYLLEVLRMKGKKVKVISTLGIVAHEILQLVGADFHDLSDIRQDIEKNNGH
jgi:uncharacterized LabA/DUF88 family protein